MTDDFTELLKINTLKRTHAEAALNQVLNKVRLFERQKEVIKAEIETAKVKSKVQTKSQSSDFNESLLNINLFEQWAYAQSAKLEILDKEIYALQPQLTELKEALKILIVREDTLSDLSQLFKIKHRKEYDDKMAETTQDVWLMRARMK